MYIDYRRVLYNRNNCYVNRDRKRKFTQRRKAAKREYPQIAKLGEENQLLRCIVFPPLRPHKNIGHID